MRCWGQSHHWQIWTSETGLGSGDRHHDSQEAVLHLTLRLLLLVIQRGCQSPCMYKAGLLRFVSYKQVD